MEVHVIRHTPIDFDKNRCYGRLEVPLAASFLEDFKEVQQRLDDAYDTIYSSPQKRCIQLANALAISNTKTDERLLEVDFGEWEGKLWSEMDQEVLNTWMMDFVKIAPPKGESLEHMFHRVSSFMDELRGKNYDKILIITHSGVIRCIWAYLLEIPLKNVFKIPIGFHERLVFTLAESPPLDTIIQSK